MKMTGKKSKIDFLELRWSVNDGEETKIDRCVVSGKEGRSGGRGKS